jgi:acyl-CoA thioesterase-1
VAAALVAGLAACGGTAADRSSNGSATGKDSGRASAAAGAPSGDRASESTGKATAAAAPRVVLLGTSLTAGLGLDPAQAYPALLQAKADSAGYRVQIVNAGLSGETSAGAVRRAGWVLDQPARLVVLEVGANDGLRGVDPDSTYANVVKLIDIVRRQRPEAAIALVQMEAPTNLGRAYTTRFHALYARAAEATKVPLWPFLLDGVAGVARLNQADGIHPNPAGSRLVAATMWSPLSAALASWAPRSGTD